MTDRSFESYARRINAAGLSPRGAFHVEPGDGVPGSAGGDGERTLILLGNAGSAFWSRFRASEEYRDGRPHPLDRWSERVINSLGRELGARSVFPFKGPPFYPFQKWARRAETVFPSPLGILIHPEYGLWHAYRGALIVDDPLDDLPRGSRAESPCLSCREQPCLHACPGGAFSVEGFDAHGCAEHLSGPNACADEGCLSRNACPAGKPFKYVREQHRFHLAAFLRARVKKNDEDAC